jgi:hypothetical protein
MIHKAMRSNQHYRLDLRHVAPKLGHNVPKLCLTWILRSPLSRVSVAVAALVFSPRPELVR